MRRSISRSLSVDNMGEGVCWNGERWGGSGEGEGCVEMRINTSDWRSFIPGRQRATRSAPCAVRPALARQMDIRVAVQGKGLWPVYADTYLQSAKSDVQTGRASEHN